MVYEHLLGCLILKDTSSRFSKLFQVAVIVCGNIPRLVALMLRASIFPSLTNDTHIVGPLSEITYAFDHLSTQLTPVARRVET
jgi:hypothetical protein